jgi:hypothetical protein
LGDPEIINKKPTEIVERFLAEQDTENIEAELKNIGLETVKKLDSRILWAIRGPLKTVHPDFHKKGWWWWEFVLKYLANNIVFVLLFGLCTIAPTFFAFVACKSIFKVTKPVYMQDPDKAANPEKEEEDDMEDDLNDPEPETKLIGTGDDDDSEDAIPPKPQEPTRGLPIASVFMAFGGLTLAFTIVMMGIVSVIYHKFIPLCHHKATMKGFHLIPNSPVMIDMWTLVGYVVLYNVLLWINLFFCKFHYAFDSTGEIGAALMGLPVGMLPPEGATEISNDAFYNVMVFSQYLIFTVLTLFVLKPLILFWHDVKPERYPSKTDMDMKFVNIINI